MRLRGLGNQASSGSHGIETGTRIPALPLSTLSSSFSTSRKKGRKSDNAMIFNYQYRMGEPNSIDFLDLCQVEKEQSRTLTNIIVLGKVLFEEHMF